MIPLRDSIFPAGARRLYLAVGLIILCTLAFFYSHYPCRGGGEKNILFVRPGSRPGIGTGSPFCSGRAGSPFLSLFSSMFLHGNWGHLISNMWALWLLGIISKTGWGLSGFFFYLLGRGWRRVGPCSHQPLRPAPAIGASGAVAGVMGAYFLLYPTARIVTSGPRLFLSLFT